MDRTRRPDVPVVHADEVEHRRQLAVKANAALSKDGTDGMTAPLNLAAYATAADLPDATLWQGAAVYITDEETIAFSDGVSWIRGAGGVLTAETTYYVDDGGSDSTGDGSVGNPWLTPQHGYDWLCQNVIGGGHDIIMQLGNGTYTVQPPPDEVVGSKFTLACEMILMIRKKIPGCRLFKLIGDPATPTNVVFDCSCSTASTDGYGVFISVGGGDGASLWVEGIKFSTTTTGDSAIFGNGAGSSLYVQNVDFGAFAGGGGHLWLNDLEFTNGDYTVSGGAETHITAEGQAFLDFEDSTITFVGTPVFTFAIIQSFSGGVAYFQNMTFSGAVTGQTGDVTGSGDIQSYQNASLPGDGVITRNLFIGNGTFPEYLISGADPGTGGPSFATYHNSPSPNPGNDFVGNLLHYGNNSGGTKLQLGAISTLVTNVTPGSEASLLEMYTYANGAQTNSLELAANYGWFASLIAIPAGGTADTGLLLSSTSHFGIFFGSGAPTLSAAKGSLYLRSDGTTTNNRAYINTNGSTTWTALLTVA